MDYLLWMHLSNIIPLGMIFWYQLHARLLMLSMGSKHDEQIHQVHWASFLIMVISLYYAFFPVLLFDINVQCWWNTFLGVSNLLQVVMHLHVRYEYTIFCCCSGNCGHCNSFDIFVGAFSLRPWLLEAPPCVEDILSGSG